jgi:hypothetical protein
MSPPIAIDMLLSGNEYGVSGFENLAFFPKAIGSYLTFDASNVVLLYGNSRHDLRYSVGYKGQALHNHIGAG